MTLLDRVRSFFNRQTQSYWPNRATRIVYVQSTLAGIRITPDTAIEAATVFACVQALSKSVAQLPWRAMREVDPGSSIIVPGILDDLLNHRPNPEMSAFTFRETMMGHALTWGNAFAEIERDAAGRPVNLWPIEPDRVFIRRVWDTGRLYYEVNNQTKGRVDLDFLDMFHIHGPSFDGISGYQIIGLAAQSIGLAMAIERFGAAFFGNNATPGGIISNDKTDLSPEAREALLASFNEAHKGPDKAFKWQYLDAGMKATPIIVEPDKGQFTQASQNAVEQICRWFGVPPHKVAHLTRATNNNIEHQGIEFVTDGILPWTTRFEQEANFKLINRRNPQGYYTRIDVRSLQRGDLAGRAAFYQAMFDRGVFSPNMILEAEGMNTIPAEEGGDKRFVPLNMQLLENAGELEAAGEPGGISVPAKSGGESGESGEGGGSLIAPVPGPEATVRRIPRKKKLRNYDPNEPRDERGRWTSGGSASSLFEKKTKESPAKTAEDIIAAHPGAAEKIADAERELSKGTPTDEAFKDESGVYSAERQALHQEIAAKILSVEAIAKALPEPGQKPLITLLGGRGGSGKTWLTGDHGPVDKTKAIYLNSDDIQERLPGYSGAKAGLYHQEASDITDNIAARAAKLGVNVIIDGTMKSSGGASKRLDSFNGKGYDAEGYYMFATPTQAAERAVKRLMTKGRFVPPVYSLESVTNEKTFDMLRPRFKKWAVYDNSGAAPVLYSESQP